MKFNVPKKKHMNRLYALIKTLFKKGFFEFVEKFGQRIFFINGKNFSYVVVIMSDEFKIDIFYAEEGFMSCHNLFNGDERAIHSYSVDCLGIEILPEPLYGSEYYLNKFKHYHHLNSPIMYYSRKEGQPLTVVDIDEAKIISSVLEKLLIIQRKLEKEKVTKYDEDMVLVFEFIKKKKFTYTSSPLINFDFTPDISVDHFSGSIVSVKDNAPQIIPGILHIGKIDTFKICESYNDLAPFEFGLTAQIFYAITEEGELEHSIYTTPKVDANNILVAIAMMTLKKIGFYDTIVTDNFMIYSALYESLSQLGVELKYEPNDEFNVFITNFMIKVCQFEQEMDVIDELINTSKEDIKNLLLDNIDNLNNFNEMFFNSPLEENTDDDNFDFNEEDDDGEGFVS